MKTKLIINLKEGVQPHEVLPSMQMADDQESISNVKRIQSITPHVKDLKRKMIREGIAIPFADDEELFTNEVYPSMKEVEKKLYRSFSIEVPEKDASEMAEKLKSDPKVNYVQFNQMNDLQLVGSSIPDITLSIPNDPLFSELYGLSKLECLKAWDISLGSQIIVAVIDTGVDYNHPDLKNNILQKRGRPVGKNFSEDGNRSFMDYHSHGTHVAGTIAATGNDSFGIIGVAPMSKIMPIRIFPKATDEACYHAIVYAVDNGAKVINNSWGPTVRRKRNELVEDAIDYAVSKGVCVIFAAGNSDDDVENYAPANHKDVIAVAATDKNDKRAGFSNYGLSVAVAAPGKDILSCKFNSTEFSLKSGTSMAAPHVTGLAALIIAKYPDISLSELKEKIKQNIDSVTSSNSKKIGTGRINAFKALVN